MVTHAIITGEVAPIKQRPHRLSAEEAGTEISQALVAGNWYLYAAEPCFLQNTDVCLVRVRL